MRRSSRTGSSRRWSGRRKVIVALFVGALVVAVPVALASHDFTDVPDSSPFHGDISAVKGAGITSGKTCVPPGTPPTYCPTEVVNRQSMAAFIHRGFGRAGAGAGGVTLTELDPLADIAVVTVAVGGVAGGTQMVVLNGSIYGEIQPADAGCPCETAYQVSQDGGGATFGGYFTNTPNFASGFNTEGGAVSTVVAVPSGTTQTFRLQAVVDGGSGSVRLEGRLTAITAPFGSTGGSTLALPSGSKSSSGRG